MSLQKPRRFLRFFPGIMGITLAHLGGHAQEEVKAVNLSRINFLPIFCSEAQIISRSLTD